jgi:uncharacterized protein YndB with AHSA1/START domain/effector-binding domain-containing protein
MTTVNSPQVAVRSEGQREIVITRSFNAPRALVFDCWTKPELFSRWFVRPGWTVPVLEMDVRPGGTYRYVMRQEDGSEFTMQGEYREILRPERLVSTIGFVGFGEVGWRPEDATVSVLELVEGGAGTLMTMTQTYPSQEVRDQTLNFMETQPGASGADGYDRLAEMVEERESDSEDVEVRLRPAQPMISIRATVKVADLAATMDDRLSALREYLERHGVRPAGVPFVRYHTFPDIGPDTEGVGDLETDVEEGVPVAEVLPGEGRIASGELPGGPVVTTVYTGVPEGLGGAYARIGAWVKEHREEPAGPAWEVYYFVDLERFERHASLPDPATWRHRIVQPIK